MRTGEAGDYTVRVVEQYDGITAVEVTFHDDGSRWRSNFATTDHAALEEGVQSLLDQGEFESAFNPAGSN
jgi:hypothetical protein